LNRRMLVGMGNDHVTWVWLTEIERVESLPARTT
jgi:hypothetical protein